MEKFGRAVVKFRWPILIIGILLLIPSIMGYMSTRINYDLLDYLPSDMETVEGQNILKEDFGAGAFSLIVTEGMTDEEVGDLTDQIADVPHVVTALSYGSASGANIPDEVIPSDIRSKFVNGDEQLIAVFFDSGTSSDDTMNAVTQIRGLCDKQVYVSGMSALVTDLKNIAEREEPSYVLLAVVCALVMLLLLTDSFLAPFLFLASIGMAIMYNLGSNYFLGEISYITKALAAILQLAVTMDYSIFLWRSYVENREKYGDDYKEAMAHAIPETMTALFSSMLTASAGFIALCFMSYTLGMDLGTVMAKGCVLGFIASCTLLPSLIVIFHKPLDKLAHKSLIPKADKFGKFTTNHYVAIILTFLVIMVPAVYGFQNKPVFYDFSNMLASGEDSGLDPEDIQFHYANEKVEQDFDVATTEMVMCNADLPHAQAKEMLDRIGEVDGVDYALGYDSFVGGQIPDQMVPSELKDTFKNGGWQLIIINSAYPVSSDEVNAQIDEINSIIKEYDEGAMLIGEAPATKDLISVTDHDFVVVDAIAIVAIFAILLIVFRSISLPFILVLVIEGAIFINLGIPYYTNTEMPFIAPVCISTIQLGSTVNYAILVTTRYRRERRGGMAKRDAIATAASRSLPAVVMSALSFFAATFGVSLYSNMSMISSLCELMARGAVISMFSVLLVLPAMFMVFDGLIVKTSHGFKPKGSRNNRVNGSEQTPELKEA